MCKWNIFNMTQICLPSNSKGVTEVLSILNYKAVLGPAIIEWGWKFMQAKAEFSIICLITKYVKCFHLHKYPHIHVLDFLQNIFIYLGRF